MNVYLISHTQDPEALIATAARLCYSNKFDITTIQDDLSEEEIDRFIERLISSRHLSPLEHASFSFAIEGVSRALLAEITRHRIASFSVRSQRYCSEGECDFVYPSGYTVSEKAEEIFEASLANSKQDYQDLISEGVAKEVARYVLPNATQTRMIVTMNVRELLHFFALRCCSRALPELQRLANLMLAEVRTVSPALFKKAGPSCVQLGYCPEGLMCCGKALTLDQLKRKAGIPVKEQKEQQKP